MAASLLRQPVPMPLTAARAADLAPPRPAGGTASAPATVDAAPGAVPLTTLPLHATGRVAGVRLAAGPVDAADERMALRLMEIGFVEGESLRVVAFGQPGDDPIGVRIGGRGGLTTFALRRHEAACVWVVPDDGTPRRA